LFLSGGQAKDGIQINNFCEQQSGSNEVVKWVLYMYSNYTSSFHSQVVANWFLSVCW
jgi:hypothetical protein